MRRRRRARPGGRRRVARVFLRRPRTDRGWVFPRASRGPREWYGTSSQWPWSRAWSGPPNEFGVGSAKHALAPVDLEVADVAVGYLEASDEIRGRAATELHRRRGGSACGRRSCCWRARRPRRRARPAPKSMRDKPATARTGPRRVTIAVKSMPRRASARRRPERTARGRTPGRAPVMKSIAALTATGSPIAPASISARAAGNAPPRKMSGAQPSRRPRRSASATSSVAVAASGASGFSL